MRVVNIEGRRGAYWPNPTASRKQGGNIHEPNSIGVLTEPSSIGVLTEPDSIGVLTEPSSIGVLTEPSSIEEKRKQVLPGAIHT